MQHTLYNYWYIKPQTIIRCTINIFAKMNKRRSTKLLWIILFRNTSYFACVTAFTSFNLANFASRAAFLFSALFNWSFVFKLCFFENLKFLKNFGSTCTKKKHTHSWCEVKVNYKLRHYKIVCTIHKNSYMAIFSISHLSSSLH